MNQFPEEAKFIYPWRAYQKRVLDELSVHLEDKKLHVVAPPGSGKTVLGLEVMLRLNKPSLILSPTIAVQQQWIQRFCELFLKSDTIPEWISTDIRNPKFLTVSTYQGLHAGCKFTSRELETDEHSKKHEHKSSPDNLNKILQGLQSVNIGVVIADEAHHLKNEWWLTLNEITTGLKPKIVGLTATPPYDSSNAEWQRYISFNGPIDAEINVPELVAAGDLCAHQDLVYFTLPTEDEFQNISNFRKRSEKLFHELRKDKVLLEAVSNHPILLNPEKNLDWIYDNLEIYSSFLIFLHDNTIEIPKKHLEVVGAKDFEIPLMNFHWFQTLLTFFLFSYDSHFIGFEDYKEVLENRLKRAGVLHGKRIDFFDNQRIQSELISGMNKLEAIKEIAEFEFSQLQSGLRMVILSDFIRKEFLLTSSENNLKLDKWGVVPIFEKLRRDKIPNLKLAVLSGSVVILHKTALAELENLNQTSEYQLSHEPLPYDSDYVLVNGFGAGNKHKVELITQLFEDGKINVLIGTKSLLGEGWDAPSINSLILASFVGSFVTSNQMRGRAMRTNPRDPNKTANIWHIVNLDPMSEIGGEDFRRLERRLLAFVGISFYDQPTIESGAGRLNLPLIRDLTANPSDTNRLMFERAAARKDLKWRWDEAVESGSTLINVLSVPFAGSDKAGNNYEEEKEFYFNRTISSFFYALGVTISGYLGFALEVSQGLFKFVRSLFGLTVLLGVVVFGGIIFFGRRMLKAFRLYVQYRDIDKDLRNIAEALLHSLIRFKYIKTPESKLFLFVARNNLGMVYCHLDGATTYESRIFMDALEEIVSPIQNPRYIIKRKSLFGHFLSQKDYHSVPEVLGRNREMAEFFAIQWSRYVGENELIPTCSIKGRQKLLKSRFNSLAVQLNDRPKKIDKWTN